MGRRFKIFVDDTGSKEYHSPFNANFKSITQNWSTYREFAQQNFFLMTAVLIDSEIIGEINDSINNLKQQYFSTNNVELKSDWLRNPFKRQKQYIQKYNINDANLTSFIDELYSLINGYSNGVKILSVVFNKLAFNEKSRNTLDGNPLLKATQVLFDRIALLNTPSEIFFDQMDDHLKINKGRNGEIYSIYNKKSSFNTDFNFDYANIEKIEFQKSSGSNFLQLADVFGYNIFRQFVDLGFYWSLDDAVIYPYFKKIVPHLLKRQNKIVGKGIVVLGGKDLPNI